MVSVVGRDEHRAAHLDRLVGGARPYLQELAAATGLTCSLYERVGFDRVLVARVDGTLYVPTARADGSVAGFPEFLRQTYTDALLAEQNQLDWSPPVSGAMRV